MLLLSLTGSVQLVAQQAGPIQKPNIILINLDDADTDLLSPENMAVYYPNLVRFATEGLAFTNFHVTTPLCGPSRAALFCARYSSHNGIRSNDPFASRSNGFAGGMLKYGSLGHHENDISIWMKEAGYRTMMIGKYLHGDTVDMVPAGWDDFYSSRGANYYGTARFTNETDEKGLSYVEELDTYRTVTERDEALKLIDQHVARKSDQPFFMYLAPLAPHQQTPHSKLGMVEQRYLNQFPNALMPLQADFQEFDFTDKSTAIRDLPRMSERQLSRVNPRYRDRVLSIKSVDDMFAAISKKLNDHQLTEKTYIFLTSDNGFSNGHHRMIGKGDSFNRSTHVPTYVIGPNIPAGATANHLLAHIDLAPTITELAGGKVPEDLDGKSFVPLMFSAPTIDEREWRDSILIENWESRILQDLEFNTASLALRFYDSVYVEWAHGSSEFYDLTVDPFQVENQYDTISDERKLRLAKQLKAIRKKMNPITTISHPFAFNQIHSRTLPIQGMAEDDSGITSVELIIRRVSDSWYWQGSGWNARPVVLRAQLTNPGQPMTTWAYSEFLVGQSPDELIEVRAQAIDDSGDVDPNPPWTVFRLDHTRPTAEILKPESNDQPLEEFRFGGTATDEAGVETIRLVIRNRATGEYWNGKNWSSEWNYFEEPVRRSGRWSCHMPDFEGSFFVSARAVDTSGNIQSPPVSTMFTVEKID